MKKPIDEKSKEFINKINEKLKASSNIKKAFELMVNSESIAADIVKLLDSEIDKVIGSGSHISKAIMRAVFKYVLIGKYWSIIKALKTSDPANQLAKIIKNGLLNGKLSGTTHDMDKSIARTIFKIIVEEIIRTHVYDISIEDSESVQGLFDKDVY